MKIEVDPASLNVGELIALVNELRRQLAEKEQEVERLKRLVPTRSDQTAPDEGASVSLYAGLYCIKIYGILVKRSMTTGNRI